MLQRLRSKKIGKQIKRRFKNLKKIAGKAGFFLFEPLRTRVVWGYEHPKYDPLRHSLIKGKRILIIGSGPSAAELSAIPDDVLVFSCKKGPKILLEKGIRRKLDLYLASKGAFKNDPELEGLLARVRTRYLVMDGLPDTRKRAGLQGCYETLLPDDGKDNFYFDRLIAPRNVSELKKGFVPASSTGRKIYHVSSGLRLLQYALYFGASEIFLIGIDLNDEGYYWGQSKKQKHLHVDNFFMKIAAEKFKNVFSLSPTSPITRYLPYKPL